MNNELKLVTKTCIYQEIENIKIKKEEEKSITISCSKIVETAKLSKSAISAQNNFGNSVTKCEM